MRSDYESEHLSLEELRAAKEISEARVVGVCIAIVAVLFFSVIAWAVYWNLQTSQQHQRQKEHVQIACVQSGKSLVHGDCIPVASP